VVPALPTDDDLIARLHHADAAVAQQAFSAMFAAYWIPLCKWAGYFTQELSVAEELVADVLADIWRRRQVWMPQEGVEAYLFGAVRTKWRNASRNAHRHHIREASMASEPPLGMGRAVESPDASLQADERSAEVRRMMDVLPARARAAVMYRYFDGLEYDEIAVRLGTTPVAVRHLVSRAFKTLRTSVLEE